MKKTEIPEHDSIVVKYGNPHTVKRETVELTDIEDISPFYTDIPIEVTGYDENGKKYKLYLDKNKITITKDENGDFGGCIGTIFGISEDN